MKFWLVIALCCRDFSRYAMFQKPKTGSFQGLFLLPVANEASEGRILNTNQLLNANYLAQYTSVIVLDSKSLILASPVAKQTSGRRILNANLLLNTNHLLNTKQLHNCQGGIILGGSSPRPGFFWGGGGGFS